METGKCYKPWIFFFSARKLVFQYLLAYYPLWWGTDWVLVSPSWLDDEVSFSYNLFLKFDFNCLQSALKDYFIPELSCILFLFDASNNLMTLKLAF